MTRNGHGIVSKQRGFSMIEMLVVLVVLGIVIGALFSQIDTAQQRSRTEQVKVDDFQQVRDFLDQFFRDINQIGFPNSRMIDVTSPFWTNPGPPLASPLVNDSRLAVGLVRVDNNEIRFESDLNGNGTVQSVVYALNGSGSCALCLQRSQAPKLSADPLTGQTPSYEIEVSDVVSSPIFTYYDVNGTQIAAASLPADFSTTAGKQTLATIKTVQVSLTVRNNAVIDPKTRQAIETNFEGQVSINNCSMAASGRPMSCN